MSRNIQVTETYKRIDVFGGEDKKDKKPGPYFIGRIETLENKALFCPKKGWSYDIKDIRDLLLTMMRLETSLNNE